LWIPNIFCDFSLASPCKWVYMCTGLHAITVNFSLAVKECRQSYLYLLNITSMNCLLVKIQMVNEIQKINVNHFLCKSVTRVLSKNSSPLQGISFTVKLPYNILLFKVFLHLVFSFTNLKSINSVLNILCLRFSSHLCSNPLLPVEILNDSFTVY
jgi:hypothetical protein